MTQLKEAADWIKNITVWQNRQSEHFDTILWTLRIADYLKNGQVSFIPDDYDENLFKLCRNDDYRGIFSECVKCMLQEIEGENTDV